VLAWSTLLKYLGPPIILGLIILGVYYKGKSVERKNQAHDQMRLVIDRLKLDDQVVDQGQKVKRKVESFRAAQPPTPSPAKDEAYSCLLSQDPLSGKCDQLL